MSPEAAAIIELAKRAGVTLATAESLTGGAVCEALVSVAGASAVVRGGIVAYHTEVKVGALGVSTLLIEREGPVAHSVAIAMARGALRLFGADVAVATTGVAGPEPHGGREPGTVVVAVVGPGPELVTTVYIEGNRDDVMHGAVAVALDHLTRALSSLDAR
ncbi:CinA family protein [Demequina lutea]|uniref:Nicotinamide-nucleotide amidase n=1 Tax=Demequina lutea TaxID=431489 RepID=A0A7Y9ZAF9_9MICO|nr:nicotinamide-nucleotide amidohydrolase family protein [Demequina lutea]NYI41799.1 nicotinamide-nucleotide amidase [Demequina lutea]